MRIISPFHDYYDTAMALGQDRARVYLRNTVTQSASHPLSVLQPLLREVRVLGGLRFVQTTPFSPGYAQLEAHISWLPSTSVTEFFVVLAGQLYPGLRVAIPGNAPQYAFSVEHAVNLCVAADIDLNKSRFNRIWETRSGEQQLTALFAYKGSRQFHELCVEHHTPLALVTVVDIITDPALGAVRFFQELDAWGTFQALDTFIGGMARGDESAMVRISDQDRLKQHGFDAQSFRKPPSKKLRKR